MDILPYLPWITGLNLAAGLTIGFALGRRKEREDWNENIQKGLIPVPVKRRR